MRTINSYIRYIRLSEAGLASSGLLMHSTGSNEIYGRSVKAAHLPRSVIVDNIYNLDRIDAEETVIEEISDYLSSSSK